MSDHTPSKSIKPVKSAASASSVISQVVGSQSILPGESLDLYRSGFEATVRELGATTPLQIYLAEKIFDCLWWIRRYQNQKRATLIRNMAEVFVPNKISQYVTEVEEWVTNALEHNQITDDLQEMLDQNRLTMDSLMQRGMTRSRQVMEQYDEMIAVQMKTLTGFQAAYENLVNRNIHAERVRLQNEILNRDLTAISVSPDSPNT
jgi:hypothetical protein